MADPWAEFADADIERVKPAPGTRAGNTQQGVQPMAAPVDAGANYDNLDGPPKGDFNYEEERRKIGIVRGDREEGPFRFTKDEETALEAYARKPGATTDGYEHLMRVFSDGLYPTPLAREGNERYIKAANAGEELGGGPDYSGIDQEYNARLLAESQNRSDTSDGKQAEAFFNGTTFGAMPQVAGFLNTIGNPNNAGEGQENWETVWNSDRSFGDIYAHNRNVHDAVNQQYHADSPWEAGALEMAGSAVVPLGELGAGAVAGKAALRAGQTMAEARSAARVANAMQIGKQGAAGGGLYGFNSNHGSMTDKLSSGLSSAALGGLGGIAMGGAGGQIAKFKPKSSGLANEARSFITKADSQGISFLPADVPGSTKMQMATAISNATLGGIPLAETATKNIISARTARDALAGRVGSVGDDVTTGTAAQASSANWLNAKDSTAKGLYEAISIPAGHSASLPASKQTLATLTEGLKSNPELSAIIEDPRMRKYAQAIIGKKVQVPTGLLDESGAPIMREEQRGGQLSWQDLKKFRTYIGELKGRPTFQSDTSQNELGALYGALSDDMRATAKQFGGNALNEFERANSYYRGLQTRKETVLKDIFGPDMNKGGKAAFDAINRLGMKLTGDPMKLAKTLRSMTPEGADAIRATIFRNLGDAGSGAQNAAGNQFSPSVFMTAWNNLHPRAKAILFDGDHRKAISDFVDVMDGMKASSRFNNTSKTALGLSGAGTAGTLMTSPLYGAGAAIAQFGSGWALSQPALARWAAGMMRKKTAIAQRDHMKELAKIARANPLIAQDIFGLQQAVSSALDGSSPKPQINPEADSFSQFEDVQ